MTLEEVRRDLKDIRYYYSRQREMDGAAKIIGANSVKEKTDRYNAAVRAAPPRLYDLYYGLYILNNSQAALAEDRDCCVDYIRELNRKLCSFFASRLSA